MANYTLLATGTAANLAAAEDGDPTVASECLSLAGYASYGAGASPGDHFQLADDGGDYRGRLTILESGTSGSPFVYEAYSGDTPVINASVLVLTWEQNSGDNDIWEATLTQEPEQVWMDDSFGDRQTETGNMVNQYDWFWESNVLYIWTGSANDPDTYYTSPGVEADNNTRCINIVDRSYVTIDGITVTKSRLHGIDVWNSDNIIIQNCIIEWAWMAGSNMGGSYGGVISGNRVLDCVARYCGDQGISSNYNTGCTMTDHQFLRNECYENGRYQWAFPYWDDQHEWTGGMKHWHHDEAVGAGVIIADNICYDNGRDRTGEDVIAQRGNGLWFDDIRGSADNPVLCYNNCCYDNEACGVFVEISSYIHVFSNLFFNNADSIHTGSPCPAQIKINTRTDWPASYNEIYNNTCVGGAVGIEVSGTLVSIGEVSYNFIKNNIAVGASLANLRAFQGGENGADGDGNVYELNCFGAEDTGFLRWDSTYYNTYDAWIAASSQTDNNVESDPSFTDSGGDDYTLASNSPCIGIGENLGSPYDLALMPVTQVADWPDNVTSGSQDDY